MKKVTFLLALIGIGIVICLCMGETRLAAASDRAYEYSVQDLLNIQGLFLGTSDGDELYADINGDGVTNILDICDLKHTLLIQDSHWIGGYITAEPEVIESKYIRFRLPEGVYVRRDLPEQADTVCCVLEQLSGLKFNSEKKIDVLVDRIDTTGKSIDPETELGFGGASDMFIYLSPGHLFITESETFIHELAHVLHISNSDVQVGQLLSEGFAVYMEVEVPKYLQAHQIDTSVYLKDSKIIRANYTLFEDIYSKSLEYWIENGYSTSYNGLYSIGYAFMGFLKETKGTDYLNWMNWAEINFKGGTLTESEQVQLLHLMYGDTVTDDFYAWLKLHESEYMHDATDVVRDWTSVQTVCMYPSFLSYGNFTRLLRFSERAQYRDLEIDIESAKFYLEKYKHYSLNNLEVRVNASGPVAFYDKFGSLIYRSEDCGNIIFTNSDVSKIKLEGEGLLTNIELTGYTKQGG